MPPRTTAPRWGASGLLRWMRWGVAGVAAVGGAMTARTFAARHGFACCLDLSRYLRAGCSPDDLGELVADVCCALEVASAEAMKGGRS
jgi:hypothetical protein